MPTSDVPRARDADLLALPIRYQAVAVTLGVMLSAGYNRAEIACYYGRPRQWVSRQLRELREELERDAAEPR